jgi:UDP-glucose 4-epimerase
VVPTPLGFDPRLQLLHESDAVEALRLASIADRPGVVNVAGSGVLTLAQLLRRVGRVRVPVPAAALGAVGAAVRNSGVVDITAEESAYLNFGRVVDTTRLVEQFGYEPRYTTAEALESFRQVARPGPRMLLTGVGVASQVLQVRQQQRTLAIAGS